MSSADVVIKETNHQFRKAIQLCARMPQLNTGGVDTIISAAIKTDSVVYHNFLLVLHFDYNAEERFVWLVSFKS